MSENNENIKFCLNCGYEYKEDWKYCLSCGQETSLNSDIQKQNDADFIPQSTMKTVTKKIYSYESDKPQLPKKDNNNYSSSCLGCLGVIVFFIFFAIIFSPSNDNVNNQDNNNTESSYTENTAKHEKDLIYASVVNICKNNVKESLTSPSTAKFPWESYTNKITDLGNNKYSYYDYVDSQNGFGAVIRTYFTCVVSTDETNAYIESLKFNE